MPRLVIGSRNPKKLLELQTFSATSNST